MTVRVLFPHLAPHSLSLSKGKRPPIHFFVVEKLLPLSLPHHYFIVGSVFLNIMYPRPLVVLRYGGIFTEQMGEGGGDTRASSPRKLEVRPGTS